MKCPKCGTENNERNYYCNWCGYVLKDRAAKYKWLSERYKYLLDIPMVEDDSDDIDVFFAYRTKEIVVRKGNQKEKRIHIKDEDLKSFIELDTEENKDKNLEINKEEVDAEKDKKRKNNKKKKNELDEYDKMIMENFDSLLKKKTEVSCESVKKSKQLKKDKKKVSNKNKAVQTLNNDIHPIESSSQSIEKKSQSIEDVSKLSNDKLELIKTENVFVSTDNMQQIQEKDSQLLENENQLGKLELQVEQVEFQPIPQPIPQPIIRPTEIKRNLPKRPKVRKETDIDYIEIEFSNNSVDKEDLQMVNLSVRKLPKRPYTVKQEEV